MDPDVTAPEPTPPEPTPPVIRLRKVLSGDLPAPIWPEGCTVAIFEADTHLAQVHALLVDACSKGGGAVAAREDWWQALHSDVEYDPALVFVVLAGTAQDRTRVVAVAQCWRVPFVKDLAVAPDWRRRGIGTALLTHVFATFRDRGARFVDLKVQRPNPSGAEALYRRQGMREVK